MGWLKRFPWISLILVLATYGVFGWRYAVWSQKIAEQGHLWYWDVESTLAVVILNSLGVIYIAAIASFFTAPMALLTVGLGGWLKSEIRAFSAIPIGALVFTLMIQRFADFVRFLVLLSSSLLLKVDLQTAGYPKWLSQVLVVLFCLIGSILGVWCHVLFGTP